MISQQEAEILAKECMQNYVKQCLCNSAEDVANALTKLVSTCGFGMCATVGQENASHRLQMVTEYITNEPSLKQWNMQTLN